MFTILHVRAPNAVFAEIFGNVFLDVICTFDPLLPTPQYLAMKIFLVSTCVYVAVSLVLPVFPETLNHEWLNSYTEVIDMVKKLVDMQGMVTLVGGLIGTTIWYISSGSGPGNPYGLAATFGICITELAKPLLNLKL
ncbi:hypothetical protein ACGC1H_005828 [Rhizoctonia solani]